MGKVHMMSVQAITDDHRWIHEIADVQNVSDAGTGGVMKLNQLGLEMTMPKRVIVSDGMQTVSYVRHTAHYDAAGDLTQVDYSANGVTFVIVNE